MSQVSGIDFSREIGSKIDDPFENHTPTPNFASTPVETNEITQDEFEKLSEKNNDAKINLRSIVSDIEIGLKEKNDEAKKNGESPSKPTNDESILIAVDRITNDLFKDQYGLEYATVKSNYNQNEVFKPVSIDSKEFQKILIKYVSMSLKRNVGVSNLRRPLDIVRSLIWKTVHLKTRYSDDENKNEILYDLNNEKNEFVKITPVGCTVEKLPVDIQYFRQLSISRKQVTPNFNYDPDKNYVKELIDKFPFEDENQKFVAMIQVYSNFIPYISQPSKLFKGDHGSGKSTLAAMIVQLLDPEYYEGGNTILQKYQSPCLREWSYRHDAGWERAIQNMFHIMIVYDNITYLNPENENEFCRTVTGYQPNKRTHYFMQRLTEMITTQNQITTSIKDPFTREDTMSRIVPMYFKKIEDNQRIDEKTLWNWFLDNRAKILGQIFDTISKYLKKKSLIGDEIQPKNRLGGSEIACEMISRILGYPNGKYQDSLQKVIQEYESTTYEKSTLYALVLDFLEQYRSLGKVEFTPEIMFREMKEYANYHGYEIRSIYDFPKSRNQLRHRLSPHESKLRDQKIIWENNPNSKYGKTFPVKDKDGITRKYYKFKFV